MAKTSESAFPGAGRWRPCERRRVRRADRRETRGQPTDCQRASEDFVASRIAALQTDQAMDVLQTRRSPHREAEAGDRCENLIRGDLILRGIAKTSRLEGWTRRTDSRPSSIRHAK